jgi:hypothetical protein
MVSLARKLVSVKRFTGPGPQAPDDPARVASDGSSHEHSPGGAAARTPPVWARAS